MDPLSHAYLLGMAARLSHYNYSTQCALQEVLFGFQV